MIYITQMIYVHEGREEDLQQFEEIVLPRLSRYSGELILRLRPDPATNLGGSAEVPYEIHLLRFESEDDLSRYMQDGERARWLYLKERSVRSSLLIKGVLA
jgi:hypothetical protein